MKPLSSVPLQIPPILGIKNKGFEGLKYPSKSPQPLPPSLSHPPKKSNKIMLKPPTLPIPSKHTVRVDNFMTALCFLREWYPLNKRLRLKYLK